ncbi:MAG TPA: alkaline phosphatase family protein [Verrucomicrobiae bacterium]|nr:alkaline phosphatase family protein [Verrucomicrobiae bacterium]
MKLAKLLKTRWFLTLLALGVVGFAAGVWMLLHPAAFWLAPWRPEATAVGERFILGPYPIERDFQALQAKGVTTVISLLDGDLPYEKVLLDQETELAQQYGMRVLNFPVKSILGQGFGQKYYENSQAAADAALAANGMVYIHCYLGVHRADNVRKLLGAAATGSYEGVKPTERSADTRAQDRADLAYLERRMEDVLKEVGSMQVKTVGAQLTEAWASYHLNRIDDAREIFARVAKERPEMLDAISGLGYCALRKNELDEAARQFETVLAKKPDDSQATEGLGYVRYRQRRGAEARALFGKVLAAYPNNTEVRQLYSQLKSVERRVVVIVVDGLRPDAIDAAPAPKMRELASAGASTPSARAVGITETLPSLATIVTGRSPAHHGLDYDKDSGGTLKLPTLFTRVRERGGRSALYFGKSRMIMLAAEGTADTRNGPGESAGLSKRFAEAFRKAPFDFALIHLREPDLVGHQQGWMSPAYLAAVRQTDAAVGQIRDAIAASRAADSTTVILTADHGGEGERHAGAVQASWTVPFMCQGPRVQPGLISGKVTLLDVAPTVLALLGLPALPNAEGHVLDPCLGN